MKSLGWWLLLAVTIVAAFAAVSMALPYFATRPLSKQELMNYGQPASQATDRAYIEKTESEWAESVASHDCSVPERVMADDFVGVEVDGSQYTKPGSLEYCKTHPTNFASNHLGKVEVRFYSPDTAIARGYEDWTLKDGQSGRFYWTDTWLKRNGKWQVVAAEDLIPAKSPY
jgi:ketosteroid isomerase-like protein